MGVAKGVTRRIFLIDVIDDVDKSLQPYSRDKTISVRNYNVAVL